MPPQGGVQEKADYPDPERTVETYMASLGKEPTLEAVVAEVRKQSKGNWRREFTTGAVNEWIREGLGRKRIGVTE